LLVTPSSFSCNAPLISQIHTLSLHYALPIIVIHHFPSLALTRSGSKNSEVSPRSQLDTQALPVLSEYLFVLKRYHKFQICQTNSKTKYVSSYSRSTYNTYICGTLFLYALLATALSLANRIYSIGSKRQEPIK